MPAVVYKGAAIPVYWLLLDKKGDSDTRERIAIMKRLVRQFGEAQIAGLLADREFIGERWLTRLKAEQTGFGIRIKKDAKVPNSRGNFVQAKQLIQSLKAGEELVLREAKRMAGVDVYLSALRLKDGELLIVASDKSYPDAIAIYAKRWEIETLFSCLKGRGFNLEETRVTDRARSSGCWSFRSLPFAGRTLPANGGTKTSSP